MFDSTDNIPFYYSFTAVSVLYTLQKFSENKRGNPLITYSGPQLVIFHLRWFLQFPVAGALAIPAEVNNLRSDESKRGIGGA